jgi:hypothetical protein
MGPVEIFQFDRRERNIQRHGSRRLLATRIAATGSQLFLVINGKGWIAGPDGRHISIRTGWAVRWNAGEEHTTGTDTGLIALAVEGAPLRLFQPET